MSSKERDNKLEQIRRIRLMGIISVTGYALIFLIIGAIHWAAEGISEDPTKDISYIMYVIACSAGLGTGFHLFSRVPRFKPNSPFRQHFKLMGMTFIPIFVIFSILMIDIIMEWWGFQYTLLGYLNSALPTIKFNFFGLEVFRTTMPPESIVIFDFMVLSIIFYLYPMEKFTNRNIWRIYVLIFFLILIPFAPILGQYMNDWMLSLFTATIVLFLVYCFIYLFYLYFSVAVKSTGKMRVSGILIGTGLLLFIITWILGFSLMRFGIIRLFAQFTVMGTGLFIFNYGFWLMRPLT